MLYAICYLLYAICYMPLYHITHTVFNQNLETWALLYATVTITTLEANVDHHKSISRVAYCHDVYRIVLFKTKIFAPSTWWFVCLSVSSVESSKAIWEAPIFPKTETMIMTIIVPQVVNNSMNLSKLTPALISCDFDSSSSSSFLT